MPMALEMASWSPSGLLWSYSTLAVVWFSHSLKTEVMATPESIPMAWASITSLMAALTPESTRTLRSPDWTSWSISSVNSTMVANFLTSMTACPNSAPVTGLVAPSPTGAAVGWPSQIGNCVLMEVVARLSPARAMAPASMRMPWVSRSPCSGGSRYPPAFGGLSRIGIWLAIGPPVEARLSGGATSRRVTSERLEQEVVVRLLGRSVVVGYEWPRPAVEPGGRLRLVPDQLRQLVRRRLDLLARRAREERSGASVEPLLCGDLEAHQAHLGIARSRLGLRETLVQALALALVAIRDLLQASLGLGQARAIAR